MTQTASPIQPANKFVDLTKIESMRTETLKVRFYGGAVALSAIVVADMVALKFLASLVEGATKGATMAHQVTLAGLILVILIGSQGIKYFVGVDRVRCAEVLTRRWNKEASVDLASWYRTRAIELHALIHSACSALGVLVFAAVLVPWSIPGFVVYTVISGLLTWQLSQKFRKYHDWALRDKKRSPGAVPYARMLKRTVLTNRAGMINRVLGMALFGYVVSLAMLGLTSLADALILTLAARMVVNNASSIPSPLMRMERASSQVVVMAMRAERRKSAPRSRPTEETEELDI